MPFRERPSNPRTMVRFRTKRRFIESWGAFILAVVLLISIVGGLFAGIIVRRTEQTLASMQQIDPRQQTTPTVIHGENGVPASPLTPSQSTPEPVTAILNKPINVLLIGVDFRPTEPDSVRSDTLIVVHIDPIERWAGMLSIPRDTITRIPNVGLSKINAAYSSGYLNAAAIYGAGTDPAAAGAALAATTVENFLHVSIDYTAEVDFSGFSRLIDSLGGVPVDVVRPLLDAEFPTENYGVKRIFIPAGLQIMDGETVLMYARSRHSSNDFDRGRRQQQVLRATLDTVRSRGLLENAGALPGWIELLASNIRTTLPIRDLTTIAAFANLARDLDASRIIQVSINPNDVGIDSEDGSDIYWNKDDVAAVVERWLAGPDSVKKVHVQVLNGSAIDGVAARVSGFLRSQGFLTVEPTSAPQIYPRTILVDFSNNPNARTRLAAVLGLKPDAVIDTPGAEYKRPSGRADLVVIVGQDVSDAWKAP